MTAKPELSTKKLVVLYSIKSLLVFITDVCSENTEMQYGCY